jgi:hypothetical protein
MNVNLILKRVKIIVKHALLTLILTQRVIASFHTFILQIKKNVLLILYLLDIV